MTDDERKAVKAAFRIAERRWFKFFMDNPDRQYLLEHATELPPTLGAPIIRVVECCGEGVWSDDGNVLSFEVREYQPYSDFGQTALLNLYGTLLPFTQNRMAKALALCWAADDELGSTDEDDERVLDDTAQPWWFDRLVEMVQRTETAQREMARKRGAQ